MGFVEKIEIQAGKATGEVLFRAGKRETISARREVIIAASSINSPKLLML